MAVTRVSVIIPSRLQLMPGGDPGRLWLDRAVASAFGQRVRGHLELEIVVGLDPGNELPVRFPNVVVAVGREARNACAVNAAVAASTGDVLAILEDDDCWQPKRLAYGLEQLPAFDLLTCTQREVRGGQAVRINDYPTPSGWMLRRQTWDQLGPLDESYRIHQDSEYIGRAVAAGLRRLHFVEAGATGRPGLQKVARRSVIAAVAEREPLVDRTLNDDGALARAARGGEAKYGSEEEQRRLWLKYGEDIW
jgi:hypothetical protein